jgi:hypothetical protein
MGTPTIVQATHEGGRKKEKGRKEKVSEISGIMQ